MQEHLAAGSISPQAVAIMRAEAQNYGLTAAAIDHPNYTRLDTANRTPDAIAAHLTAQLERMTTHA